METTETKPVVLLAVKDTNGYFLRLKKRDTYSSDRELTELRFSGVAPVKSFKEGWYVVPRIDQVLRIIPEKKDLLGYKLQAGYPSTDTTPAEVGPEFFANDSKYGVRGLYEPQYAVTAEKTEAVELEVDMVAEVKGELGPRPFSFPVVSANSSRERTTITDRAIDHQLMDALIFPDLLLQELPSRLSSKDSFDIIRAYVKDHIDPKWAHITSDYDFCFTVKKKIPLTEKESFLYDENFKLFGRAKKPKMVKGYRTDREVVVFETAPNKNGSVYNGYTGTEPFTGASHEDLRENIEKYLADLIETINRPLIDCPTCKGQGVITN